VLGRRIWFDIGWACVRLLRLDEELGPVVGWWIWWGYGRVHLYGM